MFTISPVTPPQIHSLIESLQEHNSTVTDTGNGSYTISGHGVFATAKFDGSSLSIDVTKKPFFVSLSMIENGIHSAISIS